MRNARGRQGRVVEVVQREEGGSLQHCHLLAVDCGHQAEHTRHDHTELSIWKEKAMYEDVRSFHIL
jgi:hypothetical protein